MEEYTLEEFDKLTSSQKRRAVTSALAWFCVFEHMNPFMKITNEPEINVIKIILGKAKDNL